jgi:1-acyl-sn-glycerol-3-phosphate acyltransferase
LPDLVQRAFFLLLVRPFLILFIGLRVRGREHLPERGPFLLIGNHSSHLDTITLLSLLPLGLLREVRPVAAADYFERNAVVSWVTHTLFNILPIVRRKEDRSPGDDPRVAMLQALDGGDSLVLFPEGTRHDAWEGVGPFRAGVAYLVEQRPQVPVIPCHLVNVGKSLPKGTFIPVPFLCEIHIGTPRTLSGSTEEVLGALEEAVRELAR